ncbi:MAG: rhomboid family intramembrane serine protease [Dehalococcoidia bacterium]
MLNRPYNGDEHPPFCTCINCQSENNSKNYHSSSTYGIFNISLNQRECPATIYIAGINIFVLILNYFFGGTILDLGAKSSPHIISGEFWRLLTPVFLHADIFHLVTNLFGILVFGSIVEKKLGTINFIVIYIFSGIFGNILSFYFSPFIGVGSSGSVFGILACLVLYFYMNKNKFGNIGKQYLISIVSIIIISLIFGFISTGIDNAAHLGGMIGGFVISLVLIPREKKIIQNNNSFTKISNTHKKINNILFNIYINIFFLVLFVLLFLGLIIHRISSGY